MGNVAFSAAHQFPILYSFLDTGINAGEFPLHKACEKGDFYKVRAQIDLGANFNARNNEGETILHAAAKSSKDNSKLIEFLCEREMDLNTTDWNGRTALEAACLEGNYENALTLLVKGAKIALYQMGGSGNALHAAAGSINDNDELVNLLITGNVVGSNINQKTQRGLKYGTLIHIRGAVKLDMRASGGMTPLHYACKQGNLRCITLLLSLRASPIIIDDHGAIPFELLSPQKKSELQKILMQNYFDENFCALLKEYPRSDNWEEVCVVQKKDDWCSLDYFSLPLQCEIDPETKDLYYQNNLNWLRMKSLFILGLSPIRIPFEMLYQMMSCFWGLFVISLLIQDAITAFIFGRKVKPQILYEAREFPKEIPNRIYKLVITPFYELGTFFAALYGVVDPRSGRSLMNRLADSLNEFPANAQLELFGMRKLGNVENSKHRDYPMFCMLAKA